MAKKKTVLGQEENPFLRSEQGIRSNIVYHAHLEKSFFLDIKEGRISCGDFS